MDLPLEDCESACPKDILYWPKKAMFFSFIEMDHICKNLHVFNVYMLMSLDICLYMWYHHHN